VLIFAPFPALNNQWQTSNQFASAPARPKDAAAKALLASQRAIDRIVAKGILHRNAGNRHKSRLAHAVKGLK
jgi:ribosomal protein S20